MLKLGKRPPVHDNRTALLYNFLKHVDLPEPAPLADWATKLPTAPPAPLGMMRNDTIGLCTIAGIAHLLIMQASDNGVTITITDDDVVDTYKAVTLAVNGVAFDEDAALDENGENPTDTGLPCLDVLKWVTANGIGPEQHGKGMAFVKVNHHDIREMRIACQLFGGTYLGVALPEVSMEHVGELWADASGPIAGGHCIAQHMVRPDITSYITWGDRQPATWAWHLSACDEAYAIIATEWVSGAKPAPSGFDIVKLRAYLAAL